MKVFIDSAKLVDWLCQQGVDNLVVDSRLVKQKSAFFAFPGKTVDGRQYLHKALEQGAVCVIEQQQAQNWVNQLSIGYTSRVALVENLSAKLSEIATNWYANPSDKLTVVAITGTNGKTSTSWWLSQAINAIKQQQICGLVGTLGVGKSDDLMATGLTTPGAIQLQQVLAKLVECGYQYCAMEASSIGIEQQRLAAVKVAVAVFTNFTQDHLDYHQNMDNYWRSKEKLFDFASLSSAVINIDDSYGQLLFNKLENKKLDLWSYGIDNTKARISAINLVYSERGISCNIVEDNQQFTLQTEFIGRFNVANLLAVIATLRALGFSLRQAVEVCHKLPKVPGRMQALSVPNKALVVVDYAHTPDALHKALVALQPMAKVRGGKLYCVVGCGGNRDVSKRPVMAQIAEQNADIVCFTSDNPRFELAQNILQDMLAGVSDKKAVVLEESRAKAIAQTIALAQAKDVVLIAGKGHEDYQDIAGVKSYFSDVEQATQALRGVRAC